MCNSYQSSPQYKYDSLASLIGAAARWLTSAAILLAVVAWTKWSVHVWLGSIAYTFAAVSLAGVASVSLRSHRAGANLQPLR